MTLLRLFHVATYYIGMYQDPVLEIYVTETRKSYFINRLSNKMNILRDPC